MSAPGTAVDEAKRRSGASQFVLVGPGLGYKVLREAYWQSNEDVAGVVLMRPSFYEGNRRTLVHKRGRRPLPGTVRMSSIA